MKLISFDKFFQMRNRAIQRADELVQMLKEKCSSNPNIPENYKPDHLHKKIADVLYESEKLAQQNRDKNNDPGH